MSKTSYHKECANASLPIIIFNKDTEYDIRVYENFSNGQYSKEETIACIQDTIYSNKEDINDNIKVTTEYCRDGYCWFSHMWNTIKYYEDFIENIDTVIENYTESNKLNIYP